MIWTQCLVSNNRNAFLLLFEMIPAILLKKTQFFSLSSFPGEFVGISVLGSQKNMTFNLPHPSHRGPAPFGSELYDIIIFGDIQFEPKTDSAPVIPLAHLEEGT